MTREQVELKVVEYAKSVDWDWDRVKLHFYQSQWREYGILKGEELVKKARHILNKHKPKDKYTIEDLRNAKVAILNDGTLDQLREVLNMTSPDDLYCGLGEFKYYFYNKYGGRNCANLTSLPTQSVKYFLYMKEEFNNGDKVQASDDLHHWAMGRYVGKTSCGYHVIELSKQCVVEYEYVRKPNTKIILTRKKIAEKFGITIDQLEIKD